MLLFGAWTTSTVDDRIPDAAWTRTCCVPE
jgi:hypothetical protein